MPFATQITNIKAEIDAGLTASQYTAKDLVYVSKAIEALANAELQEGIFNEATVSTILYVGDNADNFEGTAGLTDPIAVFDKAGGANSFAQIAFRNSTATSSTDIIAYMNNGTDSEGWVGMGIAGSSFNDQTYGITGPGDGYIFHNTKPGNGRNGNLVFATGDAGDDNNLVFAAGGFASGNTQMVISPAGTGNVHIETPTASTSPSTGALTVVGGVGINGDVNIAGNITFGGAGTSLETSTLSVADPLIFVGSGNTTDAVDLGLISEYGVAVSPSLTATVTNKALASDVATLTTGAAHNYAVGDIVVVTGVDATFNGTYVITSVPTTTTFTFDKDAANVSSTAVSPAGAAEVSSRRRFAGVVRDASDGVLKVFKDGTAKPTSTINFSESGLAFGDFRVAGLTAASANITSATIGSVTNTEIGRLAGVTSSIQTQIDSKSPSASPTFTGTVTLPSQTSIGTVTANQIGFLSGVSSNIQTQLDSKLASATAASTYAPLNSPTFTGTANFTSATVTGIIPTQTGNSGRFLTTNGTAVSWAVVDALPSQSGNTGRYLVTNGTTASWSELSADTNPQIFMLMGA